LYRNHHLAVIGNLAFEAQRLQAWFKRTTDKNGESNGHVTDDVT